MSNSEVIKKLQSHFDSLVQITVEGRNFENLNEEVFYQGGILDRLSHTCFFRPADQQTLLR